MSRDVLGGFVLFYYHPAKFVGLASCVSENKIFDLSRDHPVKLSDDFVGGVPSY